MKNLILYTIIFTAIFAATIFGQNKSDVTGNWRGTLDAGGVKLNLILKIEQNGGDYTAKLDIPEQGAKDLPLDSITLNDKIVKFSAAQFGFGYEGTLNEKGE